MGMFDVLNTIVPVFAVISVGYFLAVATRVDVDGVSRLAFTVASPALLFTLFYEMNWESDDWMPLIGGTIWIMAGTGILAVTLFRFSKRDLRGLILPVAFWNGGNIGLSVMRLAFGDAGLAAGAVVFATIASTQAVLGAWIAKGSGGRSEIVRTPLVYGFLAGLACSKLGWRLPVMAYEPIKMVANMTIPLMLVTLGMQLRRLRLDELRFAAVAVVLRMGVGLCLCLAFVTLFEIDGLVRQVLLVESVLPAAVICVIFAERYDANATMVASSIVLGTLASVFVLPLVLYWVR